MNQNKISNLKRINFKNKILVISYLIKKIVKIKPSQKEDDFYFLYMHLITSNGFIKIETPKYYLIEFRKKINQIVKLRKRPSSDILVYNQIYGYKEYKPVVEEFNKHFSKNQTKPLNIIDAGANIGLTSLYFCELFSNPNIIAIEPEINNFDEMSFNLSEYKNVIKLNAGVWNKDAKLKVVNDFGDKSDWSFRVIETQDNDGIQSYSINSLIKKYNFDYIDILKIDVEGSEKELFTSPNVDLSFLNKTKVIAVEIHNQFDCRDEIYKILKDYNYTFYDDKETTIGVNNNLINYFK